MRSNIVRVKIFSFYLILITLSLVTVESFSLAAIYLFAKSGVNQDSIWLQTPDDRGPKSVIFAGREYPVRTNEFHPYLFYAHPADSAIETTKPCDQSRKYIYTDGKGNAVVPDPIANAELTVVVTGGSTIFGVGSSSNASTVPSYVQSALRAKGIRANVINLGIRGADSFRELLQLRRFLKDNDVDIVLSISGRNDSYQGAYNADPLIPDSIAEKAVAIRELEQHGVNISADIISSLRRIFFSMDLIYRIHKIVTQGYTQAPESEPELRIKTTPKKMAKITIAHYAMMHGLATEMGAKYYAFLQPTAFSRAAITDYEKACIAKVFDRPNGAKRREWNRNFERDHFKHIRATPKSFKFIDLTAVFDNSNESMYIDHCHYLDRGAEVLAHAVTQHLNLSMYGRK
jgi:hypothetical protein